MVLGGGHKSGQAREKMGVGLEMGPSQGDIPVQRNQKVVSEHRTRKGSTASVPVK